MIGNQTQVSELSPGLVIYLGLDDYFRHDVETVSRKELLIFLTPTVLATAEDAEVHDANELSLMEIPGRTRAEC